MEECTSPFFKIASCWVPHDTIGAIVKIGNMAHTCHATSPRHMHAEVHLEYNLVKFQSWQNKHMVNEECLHTTCHLSTCDWSTWKLVAHTLLVHMTTTNWSTHDA